MYMFRAGVHSHMGGPYFRAGPNIVQGWVLVLHLWVIVLHRGVLWLGWLLDTPLIIPTVFHMLINGLGVWQKRVWSCDHVLARDRIHDQSLGRSCDWFPGSHVPMSHDPKGTGLSCDVTHDQSCVWTRDRSGNTFPGSCALGMTHTTWL